MINRYEVSEITHLWSEENKLATWWLVEKLVCSGWHSAQIIPNEDWWAINNHQLKINLNRMNELEAETKHDVVAFTRMISEQLGTERKWIHLGLTSTDIVDTAQNYLIKQSNELVKNEILNLKVILKKQALKYKNQLIMGRTHGIDGEPTSLGLKFLLWYDEWNRQLKRFNLAREQIEVVKISGSMGNFAHLEFIVEKTVAHQLELNIDSLSTQVVQRDRHAFLISCFANMASTLEKMAIELRLFQQSEINELAEGFSAGQKGSSSMPHKKNPISAENICGLSRLIMTYPNVSYQNNLLWHERDISHSSNERLILPDLYHLLIYTLRRTTGLIHNLVINQDAINTHIAEQNQVYFSQVVMTEIIKTTSVNREIIYDLIQLASLKCLNSKTDFYQVLLTEGITKYISEEKLQLLFNINYFLRNIESLYERVLKNE